MFADTYDGVVSVGVYLPNHANEDSFDELVRIVKPGKWQITDQSSRGQPIIDDISFIVRMGSIAQNTIILAISMKIHEEEMRGKIYVNLVGSGKHGTTLKAQET